MRQGVRVTECTQGFLRNRGTEAVGGSFVVPLAEIGEELRFSTKRTFRNLDLPRFSQRFGFW